MVEETNNNKDSFIKHQMNHVNENSDSIEIGTPGKGGAIKVYFDSNKPKEAKARIDNALEVRNYANAKIAVNI